MRNALAARLLTSIQNSLLRRFSFVFCYFLALFALLGCQAFTVGAPLCSATLHSVGGGAHSGLSSGARGGSWVIAGGIVRH